MTSKQHTYANFGEYIYWSYANLQMLHYAEKAGKRKYDRMCYMIRSKAFKAYKEGRWNIHDLLEFNVEKIRQNNYCWYCGKELEPSKLTKDHVFPRSKGGFLFIGIVDDSKEINKDFVYQDSKVFELVDSCYERDDKQPDVIATTADGTQYLIEFTFDYKVQHKQAIDYKNLNCLEIDLSKQSLETVEKFLLESNDDRKWLNNQSYFENIVPRYQKANRVIEVKDEEFCASCELKDSCSGVKPKGFYAPLVIENSGRKYRICKPEQYQEDLEAYHKWLKDEEKRKKHENTLD